MILKAQWKLDISVLLRFLPRGTELECLSRHVIHGVVSCLYWYCLVSREAQEVVFLWDLLDSGLMWSKWDFRWISVNFKKINMLKARPALKQSSVCRMCLDCFVLCSAGQACPVPCNPVGILQARGLKWVAISSSKGSSLPRGWTCISRIGWRVLYPWATWEAL